ncbi:hypothetical protein AAIH25_20620 [Arthrobacter crystallopoietes]|uniref:hypothetical protein n=1 Tax=Crystallibacter crystallopoietes TaxID=37928 RepID=UPI003D250775
MTAVAVPPPARIPLWKSKAAPAPYPACQPIDAALARTVTEHIHCGEPMALISDADLPITAPLMILDCGALPKGERLPGCRILLRGLPGPDVLALSGIRGPVPWPDPGSNLGCPGSGVGGHLGSRGFNLSGKMGNLGSEIISCVPETGGSGVHGPGSLLLPAHRCCRRLPGPARPPHGRGRRGNQQADQPPQFPRRLAGHCAAGSRGSLRRDPLQAFPEPRRRPFHPSSQIIGNPAQAFLDPR